MRRVLNVYERIEVERSNSWAHIWECICMELGIEEA
jgi:hypothetical protein